MYTQTHIVSTWTNSKRRSGILLFRLLFFSFSFFSLMIREKEREGGTNNISTQRLPLRMLYVSLSIRVMNQWCHCVRNKRWQAIFLSHELWHNKLVRLWTSNDMFSVRTIVIEERCSHSQINFNEKVAICLVLCSIDEGWPSRQTVNRFERQRRRQWNDWGLVIGVGYRCCLISEFSLIFTESPSGMEVRANQLQNKYQN